MKKTIIVYTDNGVPLVIGEEFYCEGTKVGEGGNILLSFHKVYYSLGEHYNSVVFGA